MKKCSMSEYFDMGLERDAQILDDSNLNWFEYPLFNCIKSEIYRILENPSINTKWGYNRPGGSPRLREVIAEYESLLEDNLISPDEVIISGSGVTGTLNAIAQFLDHEKKLNNKSLVIYPVPAYPEIAKIFEFYELENIFLKTKRENNFCPTYDEVVDCYQNGVTAIILTTPGNPACNYMKDDDFKKILDFAREKDFYVILDAIFEEAPGASSHQLKSFNLANNYEKLIKIKSLSKDIPQLSDLRLGWTISRNEEFNNYVYKLNQLTNFSNSIFLESLAIVEMEHRIARKNNVINDSVNMYSYEKEVFKQKILSGISLAIEYLSKQELVEDVIIPDVSNMLFIRISDKVKKKLDIDTSNDLLGYILNQVNVLVTPGELFGLDKKELWFRVTMSIHPQDFLEGLAKIINCLKNGLEISY